MVVRLRADFLSKPLRRAFADVLILAGSVGVLVWAWGLLEPTLYQHVQKGQFEQELAALRERSPAPVAPVPMAPRPVTIHSPAASSGWLQPDPLVLGEIEVPRLAMSVIVREGMDDGTLRKAAGHVPESALPGEPGNFIVLGHRDTLFRPLRNLEKGDNVRVRTKGGDFNYWIDSIEVVPPDGVELDQASEAEITLVTCFPFDFVGPAPRRMVARGHLEY